MIFLDGLVETEGILLRQLDPLHTSIEILIPNANGIRF